MIIYFSHGAYIGIEFNYSSGQFIFISLSFVCLTVIMQSRSDCLFKQDNIIRLSRIGSRRKALKEELEKIFLLVFIYEMESAAGILIFSLLMGKDLNLYYIVLLFALNFIIKLLMIIIQFILDLKLTYNFGFLIISIAYMLMLLAGSGIYLYCNEIADTDLISKLTLINKLNVINYTSLSRAFDLIDNAENALFVIIALIVPIISVLFIKIKNYSILPKE